MVLAEARVWIRRANPFSDYVLFQRGQTIASFKIEEIKYNQFIILLVGPQEMGVISGAQH